MTPQATQVGVGTAENGACTITFSGLGIASAVTGTVSVVNSPAGAKWIVTLAGTALAQIVGTSSVGPYLFTGSAPLTLKSSGPGLVEGTQYQATIVGVLSQSSPAVVPTPAAMSVTELVGGTITAKITTSGGPVDVSGSVDIASGSVDATITNSSLTIDGGRITVQNVTGTVLQTSDAIDRLYQSGESGVIWSIVIPAATVNKAYSGLGVVVTTTTTAGPQCARVTVQPATLLGWPRAIGAFAPYVDRLTLGTLQYQVLLPVTLDAGQRVIVQVFFAAVTSGSAYVYGLTSAPPIAMRSDGRAYPLSRFPAYGAGTTGTLITAPASPRRILLAALYGSFFSASATIGSLNIFGNVGGSTHRIMRAASWTHRIAQWQASLPPGGLLLDPAASLKFTTAHQAGNTIFALYDVVV